jgi:hypothetical protein
MAYGPRQQLDAAAGIDGRNEGSGVVPQLLLDARVRTYPGPRCGLAGQVPAGQHESRNARDEQCLALDLPVPIRSSLVNTTQPRRPTSVSHSESGVDASK